MNCDSGSAISRSLTVLAAGAVTALLFAAPAGAAAAGCPVTPANAGTPPGERGSPLHHGSGGLWTLLPPGGRLVAAPTGAPLRDFVPIDRIEPDGSIAVKFPWWGDRRAGARLRISGRRLDGPAPRLRAHIIGGSTGAPHFWATGLSFPRAGCWEVSARSGSARLRFVLSFVDEVTDRSAEARARPTAASRGCAVTTPNRRGLPRGAPFEANHGVAGLWTDLPHRGVIVAVAPGQRLTPDTVVIHEPSAADGSIPIFLRWLRRQPRHVRVSGTRLDGPGTLRASTRRTSHSSMRVRFPSAGCWRLTARSGPARMTFAVFLLDERR